MLQFFIIAGGHSARSASPKLLHPPKSTLTALIEYCICTRSGGYKDLHIIVPASSSSLRLCSRPMQWGVLANSSCLPCCFTAGHRNSVNTPSPTSSSYPNLLPFCAVHASPCLLVRDSRRFCPSPPYQRMHRPRTLMIRVEL
jgi:hypothetical protein